MIDWNFSFGWFLFGFVLLIAGGIITVSYQTISDSLANGVSSYDRVKLAGIITAIVGLICMANLHTALLSLLVGWIIPK